MIGEKKFKWKNNKNEKKEKDFEIVNYIVSIESDEIDNEPQEVIDIINNENENEKIKVVIKVKRKRKKWW